MIIESEILINYKITLGYQRKLRAWEPGSHKDMGLSEPFYLPKVFESVWLIHVFFYLSRFYYITGKVARTARSIILINKKKTGT